MKWGSSSSGPDMMDVAAMMEALGSIHNATVVQEVRPGGGKYATCVEVTTRLTVPILTEPGKALTIERTEYFPHRNHKSFEGFLYGQLADADKELQWQYSMRSLEM